jgi:hypothetical protein
MTLLSDLYPGAVGGGDVVGPAGATDKAIAIYDGTTGKLIQDSSVLIDDDDIITVPATDYSATSTIVGWASFNVKKIFYRKLGKQVTVWFGLEGVSNTTVARFTLPYSTSTSIKVEFGCGYTVDNSNVGVGTGDLAISEVHLNFDGASSGWTASGTKYANGQFTYYTD